MCTKYSEIVVVYAVVINISEEKIDKSINKLNATKSQGSDNILPKVFKETKYVVKTHKKIIFQKSVDEGKLSEVWKLADVTRIFKNGVKAKQKIIDLYVSNCSP